MVKPFWKARMWYLGKVVGLSIPGLLFFLLGMGVSTLAFLYQEQVLYLVALLMYLIGISFFFLGEKILGLWVKR
jgi:hypothetical protein